MVKLKIEQVNKNLYRLKDEDDTMHEVVLKFLDIDEKPNVGDTIFMKSELLRRDYVGYSNFYTFGSLKNSYGKSDVELGDIDVIKICINNRVILLKRLYG